MSRALLVMNGVAATAALAGLALLFRSRTVARALGLPDGVEPRTALRIAGMMLTALGLFLAGFAAIARMEGAA